MHDITTILQILNLLIGMLSTAVLGLAIHTIILKDRFDPILPQNVKGTSLGLLMWPGVGGIVDMVLFIAVLVLGRQERYKRKKSYQCLFLFVAGFVFLRPFVVLVYTYVEYGSAVKDSTVLGDAGYMTVESWACSVGLVDGASMLCREVRAARYLLIPIVVLAAVLVGVAGWIWKVSWRKREVKDERNSNQE
ncbi:hypothetical protein B0J11DRAFT_513664 [Dendryphion nanum]|uniref:Uncharacterized protein n=1 Tax=Dendryphion nanum TaxID=256645 RepID=A0A9P9J1N6_9PLEO|nr:hypothetical protein B0J11DRAFT_513664 [Dendryphion nanum]